MSGFSAEWLSVREPVDHASCNNMVKRVLLDYLKATHGKSLTNLNVIDLGCGTGSNLRGLAPFLGRQQNWTLVDYDPLLLSAAREALLDWADEVIVDDDQHFEIKHSDHVIKVQFLQADLMKSFADILGIQPDLITAAAFFDLVSVDWLIQFAQALKSPLYTVLTYNGVEKWLPSHSTDQAMLKAFIDHQQTDKGFGSAAGPHAAQALISALQARSFMVSHGLSNWALSEPDHQILIRLLAKGIAQAVVETGQVEQGDVNEWLASRSRAEGCEIGHVDIFAVPDLANNLANTMPSDAALTPTFSSTPSPTI
jgi:SAM-dependent methyltransferase